MTVRSASGASQTGKKQGAAGGSGGAKGASGQQPRPVEFGEFVEVHNGRKERRAIHRAAKLAVENKKLKARVAVLEGGEALGFEEPKDGAAAPNPENQRPKLNTEFNDARRTLAELEAFGGLAVAEFPNYREVVAGKRKVVADLVKNVGGCRPMSKSLCDAQKKDESCGRRLATDEGKRKKLQAKREQFDEEEWELAEATSEPEEQLKQ